MHANTRRRADPLLADASPATPERRTAGGHMPPALSFFTCPVIVITDNVRGRRANLWDWRHRATVIVEHVRWLVNVLRSLLMLLGPDGDTSPDRNVRLAARHRSQLSRVQDSAATRHNFHYNIQSASQKHYETQSCQRQPSAERYCRRAVWGPKADVALRRDPAERRMA